MKKENKRKAIELIDRIDYQINGIANQATADLMEELVIELRSLIESEESPKLATYANDNQWHCCKCDGVVFEDENCGCGQWLFWPDNNTGEIE